jgi:SAM-dependent methyltransferase
LKQTPAHETPNPDLLALMPADARRVVEVGCSLGAFAQAYKDIVPECHYTGIEIDQAYAQASKRYCDRVLHSSVEALDDDTFDSLFPSDCWVFGDTLEHLQDPWLLLRKIRSRISDGGCIVACIPNAQHWSVQARLSSGQFRYEDSGLLDRTHLRWFTRVTIGEMFEAAGFRIVDGGARTFAEPGRDKVLDAIRMLAQSVDADPEQAASDATALQWVLRAETK